MHKPDISRCAIRVRGAVQGVGFRPTVYRLATARGLAGFVLNDSDGVWIEIEGCAEEVARFPELLRAEAPALSRIESLEVAALPPCGEQGFRLKPSAQGSAAGAAIPADAATCEACLRELFDPADRRFRYPFVNCTDCGPRYTIIRGVPYDRARTTMDAFELCALCREEYDDPGSRRFHAEPTSCPECGPRLAWITPSGTGRMADEALRAAVAALVQGAIVAVKGLGGFFLAADARDDAAVTRLRDRKRRPHKPFALMARDLAEAERIVELDEPARRLLTSTSRPIVVAPARASADIAASVAPGLGDLGVMLPYTPLHHMLLEGGPALLVMTSGNLSEEPIARGDAEALARLCRVADAFLTNDRPIHARADDSVFRTTARGPSPVRRARGFVPDPIALEHESRPILAVGAGLKNTVCLTRGSQAFLSPHIGDLSNAETRRFFEEAIDSLSSLLGARPTAVAHDLHPDYPSTRWALESGLPRVGVQHHHAHAAACLAEHGRHGPALAVVFDGTGCGPAGELWGGEILAVSLDGFVRLAHLRALALPGAEAAIRQPWRLACAALLDAGEPLDLLDRITRDRRDAIVHLVERRIAAPMATGAGRWFDAIGGLVGLRDEVSYEGQAAIELEATASPGVAEPYLFSPARCDEGCLQWDLRPAIRGIAADLRHGEPSSLVAARFHETLARLTTAACREARERVKVATVALSGGCFHNRILTERVTRLLEDSGFEVLVHRRVPPNDGGIALGQAAVACRRLGRTEEI